MTQQEPILLREDRPDGRTTLVLNRPNQFNSLSNDLLEASRIVAMSFCEPRS